MDSTAYIVEALRTPRGKAGPKGALAAERPIDLLGALYSAVQTRTGLDTSKVEDIVLGCSSATGGQGANIAKISALHAGWSDAAPGITVSRFCTSGLDATNIAAMKIQCGANVTVAGGVEMLSTVSMFADEGPWFADSEVAERTGYVHMGVAADLVATRYGFEREALDAYAARSHARAHAAQEAGDFARSLVPVRTERGEVSADQCIRPQTSTERLALLPSLYDDKQDTPSLKRYPDLERVAHPHTLGSSPALCDGASMLLLADAQTADALGGARAKIRGFGVVSVDPVLMLTGNTGAIQKALASAGAAISDVDLFEVNESFAAVPLQVMKDLEIDPERINIRGGAIAMGHPLGATGGVLIGSVLDALESLNKSLGVVSICGGAGVAAAMVIERV